MGSSKNIQVRGECRKSFVEVVHLCQNADHYNNREDVCRRVRELVVSGERELQSNAKCFDSHDRDRADSRADRDVDEWVLAAMLRCDPVNHEDRENANNDAVDEET